MSAIEALRLAEENGVRLGIAGTDLILDADREPAPRVLEAIRRHKAGIVALLTAAKDDWTAEHWRAHFDERAGIAEFDGRQTRTDAEARAYECCIGHWMNRHAPQPTDPDHGCAFCGEWMSESEALPFLTNGGHVWLHSRCHAAWMAGLRAEAVRALAALGLRPAVC